MIDLLPSNIVDQTSNNAPQNPLVPCATSRISPWFTPLAYLLGCHVVMPFFFGQITITGQENIPKTGPVILAPTHRARWDALLVAYAAGRCVTGRDMRFMVMVEECQGLQGWLVRRMGGFPVDTQRPSIATLRHAIELLHHEEMLVIFPEGGIRKGKLHPLKPGIARLALTAESSQSGLGVKVVPISINYSQPYPTWGTDVNIHIGRAIEVADYTNDNLKQNAKRLTADLAKSLQQLCHLESDLSPEPILDFRF